MLVVREFGSEVRRVGSFGGPSPISTPGDLTRDLGIYPSPPYDQERKFCPRSAPVLKKEKIFLNEKSKNSV
jgi:hypothetical protein